MKDLCWKMGVFPSMPTFVGAD